MTEQNESVALPGPSAADTAELEQLNAANKARVMALGRMGAQLDPSSVLSLRIDVLAEQVFGKDSAALLEYKLVFQRRLADALRELEGQVRQAQLAAGAHVSQRDVQAMAKATGLLPPNGRPPG